jgi:hypothetical protein
MMVGEMFPDIPADVIRQTLLRCNKKVDAAIDIILKEKSRDSIFSIALNP